MVMDMTQGNYGKMIVRFSIPLLISELFQQMYSIVDSIIAGQCVSLEALAAVGVTHMLVLLLTSIALGMSAGCSIVISQLFGSKNFTKMKSAVSTAFITMIAVSLILTVFGSIFCDDLLRLLKTPAAIMPDAVLYIRIYIMGLIFLFLYNGANAIFTALGDSKSPLCFLIISSVCHVALDLIFVIQFKAGVEGLALSTILSMAVSAVLACIFLRIRLKKILPKEKTPVFSSALFKEIGRMAVPSVMQSTSSSIGNLVVQSLINSYGEIFVAAYSAGIKVNVLTLNCLCTMGNALAVFSAQNTGAGNYERVRKGTRFTMTVMMIMAVILVGLCYPFIRQILGLFMDDVNTEVVDIGARYLKIVMLFYPFGGIKTVLDGALRGAGAMKIFFAATFTDLLVRIIAAYTIAFFFGREMIWFAWGMGWIAGGTLDAVYYFSGRWKRQRAVT